MISDITDTRKELNKPVYEANKPIYGSNDDDCCDDEDCDYDCDEDLDYDLDEYGEPKVTLPEGYDDENFERVADYYQANPKDLLVGIDDSNNSGEKGVEGEEGHLVNLSIRNYVENKHEDILHSLFVFFTTL